MDCHDFLGDDGRKSVNACVKVAIFSVLRQYTRDEVCERLCGCFVCPPVNLFPRVLAEKDRNGEAKVTYNIMDIHKALCNLDKLKDVEIYSKERPSKELEQEINYQRRNIETEYQKFLSLRRDEKVDIYPEKGSRSNKLNNGQLVNAEEGCDETISASDGTDGRKHSDDDPDIVPIDTSNHTSGILDEVHYNNNRDEKYSNDEKYPIQESGFNCGLEQERSGASSDSEIDHAFELNIDNLPEEGPGSNKLSNEQLVNVEEGCDETISASDGMDGRKHSDEVHCDSDSDDDDSDEEKYPLQESGFNCGLEQEKSRASFNTETDHGSGFIISDNLVVTNKHVIQDAIDDESKEIHISNAAIGELICEVVQCDPCNDLALLKCRNLNLEVKGVCPLKLSEQAPLLGMSIFTFGYPVTHTGKTALFMKGYVSGSVDRYGREPLMVLNCPVNHGNSGGPVICRIKGELKVVAVLVQRHKKEIMTLEERYQIESLRKSLQISSIADLKKSDIKLWKLLTFKLIDALETHCQFNLCNAVPGHLVADFIDSVKYDGECKKSY